MGYLHHRLLATSCAHPKSSWPKSKIVVHLKMHTPWLQSSNHALKIHHTKNTLRSFQARELLLWLTASTFRGRISIADSHETMWVLGTSYVTVRLTLSPTTHKSEREISLQKWSRKHQVVSRAAGSMKPQQVEVPNFETLIQVLNSLHWLQDVSEWQSMSHCRRPRLLVG